jgi:hypothetical protein
MALYISIFYSKRKFLTGEEEMKQSIEEYISGLSEGKEQHKELIQDCLRRNSQTKQTISDQERSQKPLSRLGGIAGENKGYCSIQ